jgi:hypothetical protein
MLTAKSVRTLPKLNSAFSPIKLFQCDQMHDRGGCVVVYVVLLFIQTQSQSPFVCSSGFIDQKYQAI